MPHPYLLLLSFLVPLLAIPPVGAGLLHLGFRAAGLSPPAFARCWKVYLGAVAYSFLALVLLGFLLPRAGPEARQRLLLQLAAAAAVQLLAVPVLLRQFTWRSLLAQGGAVLLTNCLTAVVVLSLLSMPPGKTVQRTPGSSPVTSLQKPGEMSLAWCCTTR